MDRIHNVNFSFHPITFHTIFKPINHRADEYSDSKDKNNFNFR